MTKLSEESMIRLRSECRRIAVAAGQAIQEIAAAGFDTLIKADGSPLTRADAAANAIILEGLRKLEPQFPIVSEESEHLDIVAAIPETYWLVDPLDGTKEFIKGVPEYTVNIALIEHGAPVLGVVYIPPTEVLYSASRGGGAWRTTVAENGGDDMAIVAKGSKNPIIAVASRSHPSAETGAFLERLQVRDTIACGSSLKICAVADGTADIYPRLGPTWFWDSAAGVAIALEAGAYAGRPDGTILDYNLGGEIKHPGFVVWSPETCSPFGN